MTTSVERNRTAPDIKPPRRLSDLIEMAIRDARSLDRNIYEPNAGEWHSPIDENCCMVCLAGAMIVRTLGEDPSVLTAPDGYCDEAWTKALFALNEVRNGEYGNALVFMGATELPEHPEDFGFGWSYPQPRNQDFETWEELDDHMASLEPVIQALRGGGF